MNKARGPQAPLTKQAQTLQYGCTCAATVHYATGWHFGKPSASHYT